MYLGIVPIVAYGAGVKVFWKVGFWIIEVVGTMFPIIIHGIDTTTIMALHIARGKVMGTLCAPPTIPRIEKILCPTSITTLHA